MAEKHFIEQQIHTENYLMPYFDRFVPEWRSMRILEVGCAEGGFVERISREGIHVTGIEIMTDRVEKIRSERPGLDIRVADITDPSLPAAFDRPFDLIVMRDVIEHIDDRDLTFRNLTALLSAGGYLYITFPPRFSPFGGHHQNGKTLLKHVPWLQLLPAPLIRYLGRKCHENVKVIESVILNGQIGLSIGCFERLRRCFNYRPLVRECFISRPVYKIRFGWRIIRMPNWPLFRELFALGYETLLRKSE